MLLLDFNLLVRNSNTVTSDNAKPRTNLCENDARGRFSTSWRLSEASALPGLTSSDEHAGDAEVLLPQGFLPPQHCMKDANWWDEEDEEGDTNSTYLGMDRRRCLVAMTGSDLVPSSNQ